MTVASQVKQTVAELKGIQSTLETFASHEENAESKELLQQNARRVGGIVRDFEQRLARIELAEPQYKGL